MRAEGVVGELFRTRRGTLGLGAFGTLALLCAFLGGRTVAAGIPSTGALTYSGRLEDEAGQPLQGEQQIQLQFWSEASGGGTPLCLASATPTLAAGRFTIPLPDQCTEAVRTHPDLWIETLVGGVSLGRAKTGAVPFAVEAERASTATSASGALADQVNGIVGRITAIEGTPNIHMYSGKLATPTEWEADVIFNGNDARYCEAIGKQFVASEELVSHYTDPSQNGFFYEDWYYAGPRVCEADTHVYGETDPTNPYSVWRYSGNCGCCVTSTNWSMERRALITCE